MPMLNKLDRATLRRARDLMLQYGTVPRGYMVSPLIAHSWRRSADAGLAPHGRLPDPFRLDEHQLTRARERQHDLMSHARPVMEFLHACTGDSDSVVALSDDKGIVLNMLGSVEFANRAERVSFQPGVSWSERHRGTNAIGTALAEGRGVSIHGGEHFLERNGFMSCAAAPVMAPDGRLLGVLDISGDERQHHAHTFGLVRAAAQMIENRLFEAQHARDLHIHFHSLAEGIGTFAEGICAITDDGWITCSNQAGLALLGLGTHDLRTTPLTRILQVRIGDLLDWENRRPGEPMLVTRSDGGSLFVRIEKGLVKRSIPTSPPANRRRDALDALDTGDERMVAAVDKARKVIGKPIGILLQGEPGVGKECFARACHAAGPRRDKPFVAVNCAAMLHSLAESELFGHAPTLCRDPVLGAIREANGGTLFLDAIDALPRPVHAQLMKAISEQRVTPFGGVPETVDFVVIAATHTNLKAEVEAGHFDSDLYYRLNGLTLQLPSLRDRSDFQTLAARILEQLAPDCGVVLEPAVATALATYGWPGNLRQLSNALRAACALLDDGETHIGWRHLPDDLTEALRWQAPQGHADGEATENLREMSETTINRAIALSRGNMSEAARRLGISRNTLYRRLRGIQPTGHAEVLAA